MVKGQRKQLFLKIFSGESFVLVHAELWHSRDARGSQSLTSRGLSGQPGTSDESCAQASTSSSATSASSTICCVLTCCCPPAARSHGPDGNHCNWGGCGLCCWPRPHASYAIAGGFWGGSHAETSRPDITPGASGDSACASAAVWPLPLR